ncbi:MAG: hemerythrin family protein [Pseudomonadota bacterium]|nr:MAG: hemerythrin family protein [Pseudomonadota bacterium]
MALVEWREEFKLGIASVDHEHEELIALINEVHRQLHSPDSTLTVSDYLGEIFARISAHFALEERIMQTSSYDRYKEHKADHERLLDGIRDLMDDYEDRLHYDEAGFAESLRRWFTEHFKTHDARLHKHLPH